jgi:cytochrome c oxidase, subunit II
LAPLTASLFDHTTMRFSPVHSLRRAATSLAVLAIPFLTGGWIHGPQSTFDTKGPVARAQLDVFYTTLWVTMIIFVIVAAVLTYATFKFRVRKSEGTKPADPHQGHGNPVVELSLIAASIGALVIIAIPTLKNIWYSYDVPEEERANAYEVTARGLQWWFQFEYPAEQIEGVGPLVTANELVIPAGRPVRINLRTEDVIHSFWVPKLAGKVDMIPNRGNHMWLLADEPGYFWGQCAEYCGESHAVMRFRVIALAEDDFAAWLENQKKPARTVPAPAPDAPKASFASYEIKPWKRNAPGYSAEFDQDPMKAWTAFQFPEKNEDPALIAQGRSLFVSKSCINCHSVRGHEGVGITGPNLTHFGSRTTLAGGLLENTKENLHRWIVRPNDLKPGNKMWMGIGTHTDVRMPGYLAWDGDTKAYIPDENNPKEPKRLIHVNDDEARAIVEYLHSLK